MSVAFPPVVFWILGLIVLFLLGTLLYTVLGKGESITDFINRVLKFGR